MIFYKVLYFWIIYLLATTITPENISQTILHIYFILTVVGMFINNKILSTSTKNIFQLSYLT